MYCKRCKREAPCKEWLKEKGMKWFTKNGCVSCDVDYHKNKYRLANNIKTIAFDMDGTLCEHIRYGHPEDILNVKPRTYSSSAPVLWIDIVKELKRRKYRIVIFTRRGILSGGRELTKQWLEKYEVPYDELITEKPHFDLLIDDRVESVYHGFWSAEQVIAQLEFSRRMTKKNTYKEKKHGK